MSSVKFPSLDSRSTSGSQSARVGRSSSFSSTHAPHAATSSLSNPVAAVAASPYARDDSPPSRSESPLSAGVGAAANGSNGAAPSLSQQVSASLSAAASHERAILKWARDIQREVDEYKAGIVKGSMSARNAATTVTVATPTSGSIRHNGRAAAKKSASALQAQFGRLTTLDPAFTRSGSRSPPPAQQSRRENLFSSTTSSFLREDIQSIHPRGKGKGIGGPGRFYPTNLVKVSSDSSPGSGGSFSSAREAATAAAQATPHHVAYVQANAALYAHREAVVARREAAAKQAQAHAAAQAEAAQIGANNPQGSEYVIATLYGATSLAPSSSSSSSSTQAAAAAAAAALQSLPPALSPTDLASSGLAAVLDAPGATAAGIQQGLDEMAAFRSPALYMDLKMRQLFQSDDASTASAGNTLSSSQKAHVVVHLVDVLGELVEPDSQDAYRILSDTLKELILAAEYKNLIPTAPADSNAQLNKSKNGGGGGSSAADSSSSAAMVAQHKELSRLERLKWDVSGNPRRADSSSSSSSAANSSDSHRKAPPCIVYEGDFVQSSETVSKKSSSSSSSSGDDSSNALVSWNPSPFPASSRTGSGMASLRQIPASFLEVSWSLKRGLESATERLGCIESALEALAEESARTRAQHAFLTSWNSKKTLQLHLYARSEINLANEVKLLEHLIADLKDEIEVVNEENLELEEDYLSHGLVFGGSFALEQFRHEEETRNYPLELQAARRTMDRTLQRIEALKRDLLDIHTERDLLLTRIEVLEQAVNMMHNDDDDGDVEEDDDDEGDESKKKESSSAPAPPSPTPTLDPRGYPFMQQRADDLRGRGSSNTSVPSFLRFDGFFPNLHFQKQEVEVRVLQIWSLKTIADEKAKQVGGQQMTLQEYFAEYLQKRFRTAAPSDAPTSAAVTAARFYPLHEFVLNFFSALESHFTDQDFILFLKVMLGELHEDHYRDQMKMLANFKDAIFRWDLSEHQPPPQPGAVVAITSMVGGGGGVTGGDRIDGLITKDTFLRGLRTFFPHKSERHLSELVAILERDCVTTTHPAHQGVPMVDARKILATSSSSSSEATDAAAEGEGNQDGNVSGDEDGETSGGVSPITTTTTDAADALGSSYSSNFLECIRAQYLSEIDGFVSRIRMDLLALSNVRRLEHARVRGTRNRAGEGNNKASPARKLADDDRGDSSGDEGASSSASTGGGGGATPPSDPNDDAVATLTAYDIRSVLRAADMHRSTDLLTDLLKRGCNEPYLSKDTEVQIDKFMTNLVKSGLVHTTDHWRRIPTKAPSLDTAASEIEEEKKAMDAAAYMHASSSPSPTSARPFFARRESLEDESVYLAARSVKGAAAHSP